MRISDWSSDVCSSDLPDGRVDCCPPTFGPALHDAERIFEELRDGADGLTLIHRRDAWMMNSWLRNLPRMQKGGRTTNPLWMSPDDAAARGLVERSEEHTSELQSLMRISYAVFCLKKKNRI